MYITDFFCFRADINRETVLSNEGCPYLIDQLTRCLDASTPDSQSDRIKCVTCGCILNLSNENGEKLSYTSCSASVREFPPCSSISQDLVLNLTTQVSLQSLLSRQDVLSMKKI